MQRKKVLFPVFVTIFLIILAVALYGFTYNIINKRFFDASVTNTVETMYVIRDLGIEKVDHKILYLKEFLEENASKNSLQLINSNAEERALILSQMQLPPDGIDYWYYTPQGKVFNTGDLILNWEAPPELKNAFASKETIVVAPCFDKSGNYIMTIATPLYKNGEVAALLLMRLDGFCISRWIEKLQFTTGEGVAYIIAGDGRNIAVSREQNYEWITEGYNSQALFDRDDESRSVAELEQLPLKGESGWGSYQWEGTTNYLVYAPLNEVDWGFFVGFYGETLGAYVDKVASKSTADSQLLVLMILIFVAVLALYANYNWRKEKGYVKELLYQKQEIEKQAEELFVSEERFRVALERTSNVIFEYNLKTGNIIKFRTTREVEYNETSFENLRDELIIGGSLDDESLQILEKALNDSCTGMSKSECKIKVIYADGSVSWHRVSISSVFNNDHLPTRIIGILEDITKEKLAELDPLTGVFNKKVIVEKISKQLKLMEDNDTCVFLMFDIDNFKDINDTYGHPIGDKVIVQFANILRHAFFENALVARIGGDEFCVFGYAAPSQQEVKTALENIREQMICQFADKYEKVLITYSCGVIFSSGKDKSFETIYQKADAALYKAKHTGKNGYIFY